MNSPQTEMKHTTKAEIPKQQNRYTWVCLGIATFCSLVSALGSLGYIAGILSGVFNTFLAAMLPVSFSLILILKVIDFPRFSIAKENLTALRAMQCVSWTVLAISVADVFLCLAILYDGIWGF